MAGEVRTYVVQQLIGSDRWEDIATVEVAARTKRPTIISEGLRLGGVRPSDGPVAVRVLEESAARVTWLGPDVPVEPGWTVIDPAHVPTVLDDGAVDGVVDAVAEHLGLGDESSKSLYPGDVS